VEGLGFDQGGSLLMTTGREWGFHGTLHGRPGQAGQVARIPGFKSETWGAPFDFTLLIRCRELAFSLGGQGCQRVLDGGSASGGDVTAANLMEF
jgi:hypothetical protein